MKIRNSEVRWAILVLALTIGFLLMQEVLDSPPRNEDPRRTGPSEEYERVESEIVSALKASPVDLLGPGTGTPLDSASAGLTHGASTDTDWESLVRKDTDYLKRIHDLAPFDVSNLFRSKQLNPADVHIAQGVRARFITYFSDQWRRLEEVRSGVGRVYHREIEIAYPTAPLVAWAQMPRDFLLEWGEKKLEGRRGALAVSLASSGRPEPTLEFIKSELMTRFWRDRGFAVVNRGDKTYRISLSQLPEHSALRSVFADVRKAFASNVLAFFAGTTLSPGDIERLSRHVDEM